MRKVNKKKLIILSSVCLGLAVIFVLSNTLIGGKKNNILLSIISNSVIVKVDGQVIEHKTKVNTVKEVLSELNIILEKDDKVNEPLDESLDNVDEIIVTRVTTTEEVVTIEIPFESEEVNDYKVAIGENRVISEGENGEKKQYYKVTYEDGVEVSKELEKEDIVKEQVKEVIAKGIFDTNSLTVVVNKKRMLDTNFEPSGLVVPNVRSAVSSSRIMMKEEAAIQLEKMFEAAEADGIYLYAVSGYRSYYYQESIYNPYSGYSAPPGASEHQLGLAMDVSTSYYGGNLVTEFGTTPEGIWVENNAHKFGFHLRYLYGKEDITGYYYEPWHLRYLGVDLATELKDRGITLEEYYGEY